MAIKIDFQQGVKSQAAQINNNFIEVLALQVTNETPGGVIDSANVNFTIAFPGEQNSTKIFLSGETTIGMVRLRLNADYTETLERHLERNE